MAGLLRPVRSSVRKEAQWHRAPQEGGEACDPARRCTTREVHQPSRDDALRYPEEPSTTDCEHPCSTNTLGTEWDANGVPPQGGVLCVNWVSAAHRKSSERRSKQQLGTSLQQETPLCTCTTQGEEMKTKSGAAPASIKSCLVTWVAQPQPTRGRHKSMKRLMSASTDRARPRLTMIMGRHGFVNMRCDHPQENQRSMKRASAVFALNNALPDGKEWNSTDWCTRQHLCGLEIQRHDHIHHGHAAGWLGFGHQHEPIAHQGH